MQRNRSTLSFGNVVIGSDLDGVVYPWHELAHREICQIYGLDVSYEEFWRNFKAYEKIIDEYLLVPDQCIKMPPFDGVLDAFRQIANETGYPFIYVTHRHPRETEATKWFLKHYGFPNPENLFIVKDKPSIVKNYDCVVFFEDRVSVATGLAPYTEILIRTQPWNEDEKSDFTRFTDYSVLPDLVKNIIAKRNKKNQKQ